MNHRFACLIFACLAFVTSPGATTSVSAVPHQFENVDILVGGVPVPRYVHNGRLYVEALKGRDYAIRIRNPYPVRVAVALSVDGLNTIDARETTAAAARKWVLGPYETVTISGWQTSRSEARRFEFTTEARSYGQALGKTTNLGVISAVFFRERVRHTMTDSAREGGRLRAPAAAENSSGKARQEADTAAAPAAQERAAAQEFAATGMGDRMGHAVTQVWLDLEETAAHSMNIRYEFRPQLVALGVLPADRVDDPLQRRERARGFEPGFSPEPPRHR